MEKKDVRVVKDLIHEKLIVEETKFWREGRLEEKKKKESTEEILGRERDTHKN